MNETQRGVRDDTLLSSRKGSRVMTVDLWVKMVPENRQ